MPPKNKNKTPSVKQIRGEICDTERWSIRHGKLVTSPGRPRGVRSIFSHLAEKIPFKCLDKVREHFRTEGWPEEGVYVAHDSMGYARYVGRGRIFDRLQARFKKQPQELLYFSLYVVENKNHEREIETVLIRLGGAHLHFNTRKKRVDIRPGAITDYEPRTFFVERQAIKGRKRSKS